MKGVVVGFIAAVLVHAAILLFGGVFLFSEKEAAARGPVKEVELFADEEQQKDEAKPEEREDLESRPAEELQQEQETPPEMKEIYQAEEKPAGLPTDEVARLDAMSLSALESALSGGGSGGGDSFGVAGGSLVGGGRIGGTGAPGGGGLGDGGGADGVFDVGDLDSGARPVFQPAPVYPAELRQKKVEGTAWVVFVVDREGRVLNPKVEKSSHEGFDRAALDAVRQWRFDPAVRGGEKVQSKMRVPIRFSIT